jgi:5'-nucleotidase, C-terminal domain
LVWQNENGKFLDLCRNYTLTAVFRLDTVNSLPPDLIYTSASATAEELIPVLKREGCELIIAVTHMREPNDIKLAEKTPPGLIDLILGGHDHFYSLQKVNSTYVLRSGTDFKQLSYIEAWKREDGGWDFSITRRDIVRSIPEDAASVELVKKLTSSLKSKLEKSIGYTAAPLDGRFTTVRTRESNLGNFVCDLMRYFYRTDCALMAAGTIRGDQIYSPGLLRLKDIMNCFPFEDPVVVLKITGKALSEALENSVCLVPALEGRFPQVSNIIFEYNPKLPSGSRVQWIKVSGEALDLQKKYVLATRGYMARGKDGFDSLLAQSEGGEAEEIVSEENGVLISTILRQYFLSLKVVGTWNKRNPNLGRHWRGVQDGLSQQGTIKEPKATPSPTTTKTMTLQNRTPKHGRNGSLKASNLPAEHQTPLPSRSQNPTITLSTNQTPNTDPYDSDSDSTCTTSSNPPNLPSINPLLSPTTPQTFSIPASSSQELSDHLFHLARLYAKRWMRVAGVKEESVAMVDESSEEALPSWTRGIAPRTEGRIRVTG